MLRFGGEMLFAGARDRVELGAAVVVAGAPAALDQALLLEPEERGIDGALIERQDAARHLLDAARDAVAVLRTHGLQRLEHHQIERAVGNVSRSRSGHGLLVSKVNRSMAPLVLEVNRWDGEASSATQLPD